MTLKIIKTHEHTFLAEYDFQFVLEWWGKAIDTIKMSSDTGGHGRIDVLKTKDGLAFRDFNKTVCLDFSKRVFGNCPEKMEALKLGHFDFDEERVWRFMPDTVGAK